MNAVLIAHYNEDLTWTNNITVDEKIIYSKTNSDYTYVPHNKGQEAAHYLQFINDRYNSLPDNILFLHGHDNSNHQQYSSEEIVNKLNWGVADYFSVNRRDWYQEELAPEYYEWVKSNWDVFSLYIELPAKLGFYSSAQFKVSKNLILQYPKQFYPDLYEWLINTPLINHVSGRIFEYTWNYIFTKQLFETKYEYRDILLNVH